jgi:hypothetical protein
MNAPGHEGPRLLQRPRGSFGEEEPGAVKQSTALPAVVAGQLER